MAWWKCLVVSKKLTFWFQSLQSDEETVNDQYKGKNNDEDKV